LLATNVLFPARKNHVPENQGSSRAGRLLDALLRGGGVLEAAQMTEEPVTNILTVDVEEYFHPTEVQASVGSAGWDRHPSRLQEETGWILELFGRHGIRATFFVLGWVAEHHPRVVRAIADAGHEIGCHSYSHQLVYDLTPKAFRQDTERALAAIEGACGVRARAYRAPSYSITAQSMWALEVLAECGFTHDSSIYPITHDRYGIPGFDRRAQWMETPSGRICEVPIATVKLSGGRVAPVGGGGYLRLLPYSYTAAGIRRMNREESLPACIYFHPWEIDPQAPRLATGRVARLRTYLGLNGMPRKVERLLEDFRFSTLGAVYPAEEARAKAAS
jgi:polysaccharide deacetylase family protein (PEP-CTERM system associated)